MRTNLAIALLIYPMVQAVVFGLGFVPLAALRAPAELFFPVIAATFVVAAPAALIIAPRLRSRAWRREHGERIIPA
ncbi:hypothetical protein P7B02_02665 [Caulobacter segnis]|uniref:hypothetical protein n=1 Tax=Caulobacter segnis TaxID=88688 RepID=UPI00240FB77A|nr:hypothetical protein [Caulobacter segnis]MDG2520430.1 hypothetical protein [Caulobacter segnis]